MEKVYSIYKSNQNWKELAKTQLEYDEFLGIIVELAKSGLSSKEQIREWQKRTGMSRATYFRYKKKVFGGSSV